MSKSEKEIAKMFDDLHERLCRQIRKVEDLNKKIEQLNDYLERNK